MDVVDRQQRFSRFFERAEPQLRRALCSAYGPDVGSDAASEAFAWGWQHWERVEGMDNPVGYLFRVGQTAASRARRPATVALTDREPAEGRLPETDPQVGAVLAEMTEHQRVAVLLVHGFGYRHREVAEVLGCTTSTVANHVHRALVKLRSQMGVSKDA